MEKSDFLLKVDGIDIRGEAYIPKGKGAFPALCICHGIPSGRPPDPSDRGYPFLAERFCNAGFVTMIFNFRGTGASGGNLDILGWCRDLKAAINYLRACPEVDKTRLSLLGFSGGAAVSVYVASHEPRVNSVALCACPARFGFLTEQQDAASLIDHFRHIGVIRDKDFPHSADQWWGNFEQVSPIQCVDKLASRPLLIVHGEQDEIVPLSHAWSLYQKAGEPKKIVIIPGGGHKLRLDERVMEAVLRWLNGGN
jgi:putative redox protein